MNSKDDVRSTTPSNEERDSDFSAEHEDSRMTFARRSLLAWALPVGIAIGVGSVAQPAKADIVTNHTDIQTHMDHSDQTHLDGAHSDEPHADQNNVTMHTDGHSDRGAHTDGTFHIDTHSDAHIDFNDSAFIYHADLAHLDVTVTIPHDDVVHSDSIPHTDHSDTHNDDHGDNAHNDSAHVDHLDTASLHIDNSTNHTDGQTHVDGHTDQIIFNDIGIVTHSDSPHSDDAHYDHSDHSDHSDSA